ncbi:DUF6520 family protein [Arenibacter sp. M-2]|uniref:DUF6520 family protein n=1 Tax=Arenibacter sp. M-2 TaxID=3053612 RepID=UPI002570BE7B|nr:DUF6520 family protein [Arenibacter sp. M-2]MDL5513246.1 DUF6520 family protein [Arenibacter sp. M-2]
MKKLKLILPMLAFIFAIALSFAFENATEEVDYATKYVRVGSNWHAIEVDCGLGSSQCVVIFTEDTSETPYQVYNSQDLEDEALGSTDIKPIEGPAPSN